MFKSYPSVPGQEVSPGCVHVEFSFAIKPSTSSAKVGGAGHTVGDFWCTNIWWWQDKYGDCNYTAVGLMSPGGCDRMAEKFSKNANCGTNCPGFNLI